MRPEVLHAMSRGEWVQGILQDEEKEAMSHYNQPLRVPVKFEHEHGVIDAIVFDFAERELSQYAAQHLSIAIRKAGARNSVFLRGRSKGVEISRSAPAINDRIVRLTRQAIRDARATLDEGTNLP